MLKIFLIIIAVLFTLVGLFVALVIAFFWSVGNAIGKSRYQDDDHVYEPVLNNTKEIPKNVKLKDLFTPRNPTDKSEQAVKNETND